MFNFDFLEKGLGIVSPTHSVYDFSRKCLSCYILLTDQISLSDCLYFLRYLTICELQLFVNQAVNTARRYKNKQTHRGQSIFHWGAKRKFREYLPRSFPLQIMFKKYRDLIKLAVTLAKI